METVLLTVVGLVALMTVISPYGMLEIVLGLVFGHSR